MTPQDANNILIGLDVIDSLLGRIQSWNTATRDAAQEGRDLTDAEVQTLRDADNASDDKLEAAIQAAAAKKAAA